MAWVYNKIQVIENFSQSHFIEKNEVNEPAGFEVKIPDLWAENSVEIVVDCYDQYSATEPPMVRTDFGNAATTKLYIKRRNSEEDAVELATGTVTTDGVNTEYNQLTYQVAKDAISAAQFADEDCIIFGVVLDTDREKTWAQNLRILDEDGTGAATKYSKDIDVSMIEITGNVTLTPYPGLVLYRITANATITLGAVATYDPQMMMFTLDGSGLAASLVGTINGDAGGIALDEEYQSCIVIGDGSDWINANLNVNVR